MNHPATVVLADDHPLLCSGLKSMLEPVYSVVSMVYDGNDVLGTVTRYHPDIVLLDLSLPGQNGIVLTRLLKQLDYAPKVVVVTMYADRVYVDEAMRAGADGYVLKTARGTELRRALGEVLAGGRYVTPEIRPPRPDRPGESGPTVPLDGELASVAQLTQRQRQVLLMVGQGCSNQEIATRLGVSAKAIEYHRAGIRQALAITSQAGLYRVAIRYAERIEQE